MDFFNKLLKSRKKYYQITKRERTVDKEGYLITSDLTSFININELYKDAELYKNEISKLKIISEKLKSMQLEFHADKTIIHNGLGLDSIYVDLKNCNVRLNDLSSLTVVGNKNDLTAEEQEKLRISMYRLSIAIGCIDDFISPQTAQQQK